MNYPEALSIKEFVLAPSLSNSWCRCVLYKRGRDPGVVQTKELATGIIKSLQAFDVIVLNILKILFNYFFLVATYVTILPYCL